MGNGYNHHVHHQNLHLHYKSTFLPMLCSKPSIKDVALPKSTSFSNDPLSPKIGCMGQVKRNNKIVGLPTSHKFTITARSNNNVKYFKLKRLFSGRNLMTTTNTNNTTTATTCRRKQENINGTSGCKNDCDNESCVSSISIVDMDPPLPVIKKVHKPSDGDEAGNLYKRRSGGVALRGLKLQDIQLNRHQLELSTV